MPQPNRNIIVVGASAGGVQALQRLVGGLPKDLPAAVFIVLHVWPGAATLLPNILRRATSLRVDEAVHGDPIENGRVYVAPADMHLFVEAGHISVLRGPKENRTRPSINPLFRSAAMACGNRVIGILLSGTLDDGTAGLWAIKRSGGLAIAQADAEFPEMAESARANVELDYHVPLVDIPPLLRRLTAEAVPLAAPAVPEVVQLNDETAKMAEKPTFQIDAIGKRSVFSCPECNGALWEVQEGSLQYRCHVGHAFSADVLRAAIDSTVEQALWSALRALKESAALDERLAAQSTKHKLEDAARVYRNSSHDKFVQADHLQQFLASLRANGEEKASDQQATGG